MPSARRQKKAARAPPKRPTPARRPASKPVPRPAPKKAVSPGSKAAAKPAVAKPAAHSTGSAAAPSPPLEIPLPGGRRHVLSLSFVRDGDEFLARLETDGGHITELKNRSLDQLLTLVASELEDLLE